MTSNQNHTVRSTHALSTFARHILPVDKSGSASDSAAQRNCGIRPPRPPQTTRRVQGKPSTRRGHFAPRRARRFIRTATRQTRNARQPAGKLPRGPNPHHRFHLTKNTQGEREGGTPSHTATLISSAQLNTCDRPELSPAPLHPISAKNCSISASAVHQEHTRRALSKPSSGPSRLPSDPQK